MELKERLAWLHLAATSLQTEDETELKFRLKDLIEQAEAALDAVKIELRAGRGRTGWPFIGPGGG